jgi:hypothetical protein
MSHGANRALLRDLLLCTNLNACVGCVGGLILSHVISPVPMVPPDSRWPTWLEPIYSVLLGLCAFVTGRRFLATDLPSLCTRYRGDR